MVLTCCSVYLAADQLTSDVTDTQGIMQLAPLRTIQHPTLCTLVGIGSGHRQLIAVTCIAEHA